MSRSRKKPIIKDKGFIGYNKVFRRRNKILLRTKIFEEDLIFFLSRELTNSYDICDYIFRDIDKWFYNKAKIYKCYNK